MNLRFYSELLAMLIWAERPDLLGPVEQYHGASLVACVFETRLESGWFGTDPWSEATSGAWAFGKVDVGEPPMWIYDVRPECPSQPVYFLLSHHDLVNLGLSWSTAIDSARGNGYGLYVFSEIPPPLEEFEHLAP